LEYRQSAVTTSVFCSASPGSGSPPSSVYVLTSSSSPFSVADRTRSAIRSMNVDAPASRELNSTVVVDRNVSAPGCPAPSVTSRCRS
jgi:hypothetical protein